MYCCCGNALLLLLKGLICYLACSLGLSVILGANALLK